MRRSPISAPLLALGLTLLCWPAHAAEEAQRATPADETALFALWLREGREVASWRSQVGAARFDILTATAWPNPQLQINTSTVMTGRDHPPDGLYNWGPQITVPLPIFGQIQARRAAALAALEVAEVNLLASVWDRAADLKQEAVARAFAEARVEAIGRNLSELAAIGEVVRTRAAAGANPQYDVLRVSTSEATFRAALAAAQAERDAAETRLRALVAVPGVAAVPLTRSGLAPFAGPEDEAALVDLALKRRPDLELARRQETAAQASAARFRREVVPTPSVYLGTYQTYREPSLSVQAGVSFDLPLFDRNRGPIGRATTEAEGSRVAAEGIKARVEAEVRGAWRVRAAAARALEQFRTGGLASTAELLSRATVSYKAGAFSILDLLDAHRAVWDARAQELDLERAYAQAQADLERAAALFPAGNAKR